MDPPEEWTILDGPARGQVHKKGAQISFKLAGVWYRRIAINGRYHWVERGHYFRERAVTEQAQERIFGTHLTARGNPFFEMTENELRTRAREKQDDE